MKLGAKEGHWVVLENIHIVTKWLKTLEKTMEDCSAVAHPDFRFYLTAEPAPAEFHIMPSGILQVRRFFMFFLCLFLCFSLILFR